MSNIVAPPAIDDLPLEVGSFVELHSLRRQDLNGLTGEVRSKAEDRWAVQLDMQDKRKVTVKPENLKRIPLLDLATRRKAFRKAEEGLRSASVSPRECMRCCLEAIRMDRCCVYAYVGLGQSYFQLSQEVKGIPYFRRAVAQAYAAEPFLVPLYGLRFRHQLAGFLSRNGKPDEAVVELEITLERGNRLKSTIRKVKERAEFAEFLKDCEDCLQLDLSGANAKWSSFVWKDGPTREEKLEACNKAIMYADRYEERPKQNKEHLVSVLSYKAFSLAYKSVIFDEGCWDESVQTMEQARSIQATAMARSLAVFQHARIEELVGDNATDGAAKMTAYQRALELLRESEQIHTDEATSLSFCRVQAKLRSDLATAVNPETGDMVALAMRDVTLEQLPVGPSDTVPTAHGCNYMQVPDLDEGEEDGTTS